ncbi:MAG: hypothetical protein A2051_07450 [Desulfovibrionales bacterium GWA2_65_9]|nr:MAG: hypothetical protein A2051_07450 [Desulfovibrionales bacterium GWA2_65_9]
MAKVLFIIQREELVSCRDVMAKILFPVETAFAAALLEQHGHETDCFDLYLAAPGAAWKDELADRLRAFKPDLVVSAPQTLTFLVRESREETREAFALAKGLLPGVTTVYTGPFATSYPAEAFAEVGPDALVRGEYDVPLLAIATQVAAGTLATDAAQEGGVVLAGQDPAKVQPYVNKDLDALPFPAYARFGLERYFDHRGEGNLRYAEMSRRYTHYTTSRGCPCQCCFCNVAFLRGGRLYRTRSVANVLDDLERLVREFGVEEVHLLDENPTLNRRRTRELCQGIIDRKLNLRWMGCAGVSVYSLDRETLELLKASGCYRLHLAFESGDQDVLKNIVKKPVDLVHGREVLGIARELDFEIVGYFVIGLPGETKVQIGRTLELARDPRFDYVTISIATPQAGTELERMCKEQGLVDKDAVLADLSRRSTGVYETAQFTQQELESFRWREWDQINFGTPAKVAKACRMLGVSPERLAEMRESTAANYRARWGDEG